jgi:hypothetical protein
MRGSRDAALAFAVRTFMNSRLHAMGEATDLSFNSANHSAELRLNLRGESEPVDIRVSDIHVQPAEGGAIVIVGDAIASREWVSGALSEFVVGRALHVSRKVGLMLRLLAS